MKDRKQSMRDKVRARAEKRRNIGGLDTLVLPEGVEFYKPEKGTEEFDILPYRVTVDNHPEVGKGDQWYERTYLAHRNVGPEEKAIVCPRTVGKKCPVCEEYNKLNRDPDADEEVVKALKAKERELFNVVMKDGDGSVMLMDISYFLFGRQLEAEVREGDEDNANFAELKGGKTLKVRWEAKSMGQNKFVEAGRIDFSDRDDIDEEALESVVDLDKALKILSYEEISAIFHGADEDASADNDEEDAEEQPKKKKVVKEEEAEEEEEEEEAEEQPPKKKKAVKEEEEEDDLDYGDKKKPAKKDDNEEECIACDGTGKTTKGKTCPICDGTGKTESEEKPEAEEEEEEQPKKKKAVKEEEEEEEEEEKPKRRVIKR